jgi:hypothetical protein
MMGVPRHGDKLIQHRAIFRLDGETQGLRAHGSIVGRLHFICNLSQMNGRGTSVEVVRRVRRRTTSAGYASPPSRRGGSLGDLVRNFVHRAYAQRPLP